jgi:hypothetical protein
MGLGVALILVGAPAGAVAVIPLGAVFVLLGLTIRAMDARVSRRLRRSPGLNRAQAEIEERQPAH